jgi:hypothetical protein
MTDMSTAGIRQSAAFNGSRAREPGTLSVEVAISRFTLKRRSNPAAAFAEMLDRLLAAATGDTETARAFASFQKTLKGVAVEHDDAVRLAALRERGSDALAIKVGSLPPAVGPGLAYLYDAALETLRSTDRRIMPEMIDARAILVAERSLKNALPLLGSMSVTALELALTDKQFGERLHQRAAALGVVYLNQPPGICEFCEISVTEADGTVNMWCGSKTECDNLGGIFILALLLWGLYELLDWLF